MGLLGGQARFASEWGRECEVLKAAARLVAWQA